MTTRRDFLKQMGVAAAGLGLAPLGSLAAGPAGANKTKNTGGDKVKVTVRFRGREMAHTQIGMDLLKKFAELCADVATMDKSAKMEGRLMSMFLSPKAQKAGK